MHNRLPTIVSSSFTSLGRVEPEVEPVEPEVEPRQNSPLARGSHFHKTCRTIHDRHQDFDGQNLS